MADSQVFSDVMMDLETPKKLLSPEPSTPRRSERKRALFPTASPQTSDLGHMSPLGSSPDRYSSAPASPDSLTFSPLRKPRGPVSPFGRKATAIKTLCGESPRKKFSEIFSVKNREKFGGSSSSPLTSKPVDSISQHIKSFDNLGEIVPADQLEQTVLSVLDESDCPDSPEHTLGTTPHNKEMSRTLSDCSPSQPLTPSKRRSMPASCSGSTTSTSPHSPDRKRRVSLESRSRSAGAELPRARTSLFSVGNRTAGAKRPRDDGIYLTGRNIKRRKVYGEINAGVKTGIRRPPKVKPKVSTSSGKKQGKVKSIWDVGPKSAKKKSISPIKIPKMSLFAQSVKRSDEEIASQSASACLQVRSKRNLPQQDEVKSDSDEEEIDQEPDPSKRFFKCGKPRSATITLSKNVRIKVHKGKFIVDKTTPAPPAKRRRQLYNQEKQIEAINSFDDTEDDVAASTREDVKNILQKLDEDKSTSPETQPAVVPFSPLNEPSFGEEPPLVSVPEQDILKNSPDPSSPTKIIESPSASLMSPLSKLVSSTSTLSINVGGDSLHLTEAQVQALTAVPDIMEDDDLPLCEPLPEETSEIIESKENVTSSTTESESTPVKYFPIFNSNFSHQKAPLSPTVARRKRSLLRPIGNDQYQLDAGQKRFGSTECGTCSAIYQMGEPEDERAHQEFHDAVKNLKFMGWKNERVVGEFGKNRVVVVRPGDPKVWWNKALEILHVADKDLGFAEGVTCDPNHSMVYLYISDKSVVGCLMAISLKKANKMVETAAEGIDCCTAEEYPVKCGVSRIWVHRPHRRNNIGRSLMDCLRKTFIFGHVLSLAEIAFSSPTMMGKIFAEHYTGRKDYHVYIST
ncbi:N-acetyltransferase ESCO2 [Frankliniella fusca]|uniref:N-acetyltransferase ESCO2 n=1 Tax=Frankliniella fusca TaxID=407009 RepID=A0AAE1L959_9NEOP|nr:N-acetyltransferase ESCO2 [Frankliniella fusca]